MNSWCCPLPPRRHRCELRSAPRLTRAHIQSCLGVVGVVTGAGVKGRDLFVVCHMDEGLCVEHALGDVMAELGNLFADVTEESIRWLASNDHDGVDGNLCKVHCHGSSRVKQVGVDLTWFEAEFILSHNKGSCMQCSAYICACDATDLTHDADEGFNSGVVGSPFVVVEALDERCRLADWEHDVVVGCGKA